MPTTTDRTAATISGMQGIIVSDIVPNADNTLFTRTMKFYDVNPSSTNARPILELTLTGLTKAVVEIQTPQLEF